MVSMKDSTHDIALKPRLLRSLLREFVPEEKHPFNNPSELSYVVSTIKTHKLLSEWTPQLVEKDTLDEWKAAIDSWVHRLLTLASSNSPDKCWAGICLLGVTCQECNTERFLASYTVWLNEILSHIQPSVVSHFVKAASCASLSDMFIRLSGLSNAKRDATSQATKLIHPLLKLFHEDVSSVVLEEASCLLCTMIKFFPQSANRNFESVEAAIVSKLMSGKCSVSVLKKLGYGLSLLPKSKGDEDSWSLMMVKILLSINSQLNDAFQGLEEDSRGTEITRALLPPGKESPPPLGGLTVSEQSSDLLIRRPEQLLGSRISTLMDCCCNMLTNTYPVMVPVPIRGVVALTRRVLMVDSSLSQSFMTILKQEFVCSELPLLQLHSLEILMALVKGSGSLLLPHVADIVRLLTWYMRRCIFPDLRIKVYSIMKVLMTSMGVGIAIHLSQDVINNIFVDLDFICNEKGEKTPGSSRKIHEELPSVSRHRKRKQPTMTGSVQEQPASDRSVEKLHIVTPITVKKAALEALEALLTVGGSMRSESWRVSVDHLLITLATDACRGGLSNEEKNILSSEPISLWEDFQLAALRALLASLLSPGQIRPSHLALALELFRGGMHETGTKLAEFCRHALLSLEVLIHPRSLPLLDIHSGTNIAYPSGMRQVYSFRAGKPGQVPGEPESDDDELNEDWLANNDESEGLENANCTEKLSVTLELPSAEVTSVMHASEAIETRVLENCAASPPNTAFFQSGAGASETEKLESFNNEIANMENGMVVKSGDDFVVACEPNASKSENVERFEEDRCNAIIEGMSVTLMESKRSKGLMFDEPDDEYIPDIVDDDSDGTDLDSD